MDPKQFHRRTWGLVALLAMILISTCSAMYQAQIVQGDSYYARSTQRIGEEQNVEAARGEILDRYGRVLVSNQTVYQVKLDTASMKENKQAILLELMDIAREQGVEWADNLPVTRTAPYAYTRTDPFYADSVDEEGEAVRTLTRLGKLCVKLGWISQDIQTPGSQAAVPTAEELMKLLCDAFGLDVARLGQRGARDVAGVLYELELREREIYWEEFVFAQDVDIDFISRLKEECLSGVLVEATALRQYHTTYAAHLLGFTGPIYDYEWDTYKTIDSDGDGKADYQMDDTVGKDGVERAFESYLRGSSGTLSVERNAQGKIVSSQWAVDPLTGEALSPDPGDNVVLTIDIDLQKKVEDTLAAAIPALESPDVEGAACVIQDVNTGEVLAMASYPTFDLANYNALYSQYAADPLKPLYNRALLGTYPPGSTFKMVTAIAGLEEEIITPTTKILDTGVYTYYTKDGPKCWYYRQYGRTHGLENVTDAIKDSCNVFFYDVGRQLGIQRLQEYAALFGLGEYTGIELTESRGVMAGPEYTESMGGTWYEGSTLSVAIGQESSQFTPIQLTNYIATLVNGGTRYTPHLLKTVKSSDFSQVVYEQQPQAVSSIDIQPENLEAVKKGMLELTTSGSVARYFQDLPFQVGAKTGSAQVSAQTESNAVFVCFAPYDDPQIAMTLVVEKGGSGSELGAMAADILEYYFSAQATREEIRTENTLIR